MHSEATGTGKEQQTGRFSYAQYRSKVYHVHQVCYVLQDRRISRLISRTFLEDLPLRPGSGWGRRLDRRNPAGAASSDVHLPAYSGRGWEPSKGHWRPLPRRWMAQGACPLTRYSGVGLGETTGPSKPRRGSFERCVSTRCPGVGWEKTTADSCPTGPSLDVTGAMSAYPSSRGRVGKDDSRLVPDRPVAGCYRGHVCLPFVPGSGGKRRQQLLEGPARRWIPSTAHCITGKSGVGSGNHCVRDLFHVPRGVPTAKGR